MTNDICPSLVAEDINVTLVPTIMMKAGMMIAGSDGACIYSGRELAKSARLWNGRPVTLEHGGPIVGGLRDCNFADGQLSGVAALDENLLILLGRHVFDRIVNGDVLEVSPGLTARKVKYPTGLTFGVRIRPHHLAILVRYRGAMSIADGVGIGYGLMEEF
jgi:hypothetical protein